MYVGGNYKRRIASVGNILRVAAVLAWRGALSSSPFLIIKINKLLTNITVTYSSSRYWWVTLCDQHY